MSRRVDWLKNRRGELSVKLRWESENMRQCRTDHNLAKAKRNSQAKKWALKEYEASKARATQHYDDIQAIDKELSALGVSLNGFKYAA